MYIARKHLTMSCDCLITGTCAWVSIVHASKKIKVLMRKDIFDFKYLYMYLYVDGAKVICIYMMLYDMESADKKGRCMERE